MSFAIPLRTNLRTATFVALGLLCAGSASAQAAGSLDQNFREGFALSAFEPAPAGDRFFAVPDASSQTDGRLRLMLLGDWAYGASLSREDAVTGEKRDIVSSLLTLHAGVAYPITSWLHAHANVPFVALQKGDDAATNTPDGGKLGDIRLGVRVNVLDPDEPAVAFGPGVDVWLPTGSEENLTGDGAVRVNPRATVSGKAGPFAYAANVGYLFRKNLDVGSLEVGDAVTFGAAAGLVLFDDRLQVGPEFWGNTQTNPRSSGTETTPLSALFGARFRAGDVVLGAGVGPGLSEAPGVAPRVVASIALAPETTVHVKATVSAESLDRDRDGVVDSEDACPDEPGLAVSDAAKNGCPDDEFKTAAPADGDGDGIADQADTCPNLLGDASDNPSKNGCPAEVSVSHDGDGDGVVDDKDACPHDAGQPSEDAATNGCPPPKTESVAQLAAGASGEAAVTFAGFHVFDDGTSPIFVKVTSEVPVEVKRKGKQVEYLLRGAKVVVKNNKNPLITKDFVSPVMVARLVPEKEGVVLHVELREVVTPTHRVSRHPDGSITLHVDFPPKATPEPSKPPGG